MTFVLAILTIGFAVACFAYKHIKVTWYKRGVILLLVAFCSQVIGVRLALIPLIVAAGVSLSSIIAVGFGNWLTCKSKLARIVELADPMQPCCDVVAAFVAMRQAKPGRLALNQLTTFNRYRVFCHIALGNCAVARNILNKNDFEPVFKHFALGVIAEGAGDYERSRKELDAAFASDLSAAEPFIVLQLEHNRAISRINDGQFLIADGDLEKMRFKVKDKGIRNKAFLNLLYENLILNKTRLDLPDEGAAAGWELIDEYAETLDAHSGRDQEALFNLKLMFLRQLGATRAEKEKLFADELTSMLKTTSLSDEQRTVAMASLGRIAWADGLDPERVLEYFGSCNLNLKHLKPADRLSVFKNLFVMLGGLATADPNAAKITNAVNSYYENDMQHDLVEWESSLPSEAIKLQAYIYRERAALYQIKSGNWKQVASSLKSAICLLERGLQIMDSLEVRWELLRHLTRFDPTEAKKHIPALEERLTALGSHPSLGYPYYELCLCYGLLGMRDKCRDAYKKAVSFETPMGHYAPGVRQDVAMASFCARFYLMMNVLGSTNRVRPLLRTSEGRRWLDGYPDSASILSQTILLGRFLGYQGPIPLESRTVLLGEGLALANCWLTMPELWLVFSLSINSDDGSHGAVFLRDRFPLLIANSNTERSMKRQGFEMLPPQIRLCGEVELSDDDRTAIADILEALDIACENERPTVEELRSSFRNGCADIPISD